MNDYNISNNNASKNGCRRCARSRASASTPTTFSRAKKSSLRTQSSSSRRFIPLPRCSLFFFISDLSRCPGARLFIVYLIYYYRFIPLPRCSLIFYYYYYRLIPLPRCLFILFYFLFYYYRFIPCPGSRFFIFYFLFVSIYPVAQVLVYFILFYFL
jgi:hypothetical protein